MKSKFLFVMSVAATMLLASCNNMPAETSQPASEPASTSATQGQVISVSCSTTEATLQLNETLQLSVTVQVTGGASNKVTYASSNADVAEVKDTGLVTAKAVGDATITITAKADPTKSCTVAIHVAAFQYDAINTLDTTKEYTVKGKVVATNTKSYIVADATGSVMVYLNDAPDPSQIAIGDVVEVKGKPVANKYSCGFAQFDDKAVATKLTGEQVEVPAAIDLTKAIAEGWVTAYNGATNKETQFLSQDAMKLYKWETTVTTTESGGKTYFVLKLDGCDVVIEPSYLNAEAFPLVEGKKYSIEGYYVGYRSGYASVALTKAEEKTAEVGDVTIATAEDAKKVKVDADLELTASIYGVENQSVTWGFKVDETISQTSEFATLTPDNENGNKVMLHGVKAGKVIVVATYEQKSAEVEITVESNAVAKTIAECTTKDEVVALDVVVASSAYQGYVIADATSHVFVYEPTSSKVPAVGSHLKLEGTVGARYGGTQIKNATYEIATEGVAPTAPAPTVMTETIGKAMATAAKTARNANPETFMLATDNMPLGLYKFENVTVGGQSTKWTWDVGEAHFYISNTDSAIQGVFAAGKNYDIEGVVFNYRENNNQDCVTVVVTKAEEHVEAGAVSIEGPAAVNVGDSIELTASVAGSDAAAVTWTFADGTTVSDYATLTPDNENGNKVTVTGVAAGNVTVVATCGGKSAEHAVQIKEAPQPGSLVAATIAKGTTYSYDNNTVNGKASIKMGKKNYGGDMTITVGAGATKLVFFAAGWTGESSNITLVWADADPVTVAVTEDSGLSGNGSTFTVANEESHKCEVALSGIEAETVITVTSTMRVFVWDVFYAVGNAAA